MCSSDLAVIHALYQPYLNGGNGGRGIRTAGVATPALTALIEKAELDYDPVVNGQDFSIKDLKLTTQSSGATATVVAAFQNFDQPTRVTYTLTSSEGGWHVDDVRFEDGRSLRKELGG